jgi:hypothetical protein
MKFRKTIGVLLVLFVPLVAVHSKGKKRSEISALFANAHYVYVQAEDGDMMKPGLYSEDREAISNVEQAVRDWNRYAITTERGDADLVFVVRKGRLLGAQVQGGISAGPPSRPGSQGPGQQLPQAGNSEGVGVGTEVGPADDILRVFTLTNGKLNGPLWSREMQDGLAKPGVLLVRQLKEAVESSYPAQTAPSPPKP